MIIFNYLKATISSLQRRKGFAVLTIITMAFSVVSVTCVATYYGLLNADLAPEVDKKNLRYIIPKMYDKKSGRAQHWFEIDRNAPSSLSEDLKKLEKFGQMSLFAHRQSFATIYNNNKSIEANVFRSDSRLFEVFSFNFIAGRPFLESEMDKPQKPVVINRDLAEKIFGTTACIGEILELNYFQCEVVGVVEPTGPWSILQNDFFTPNDLKGNRMVYLAQRINNGQIPKAQNYLDKLAKRYNNDNPDHIIRFDIVPFYQAYAEIHQLDFLLQTKVLIPLLILVLFLPGACMINLFQSLLNDRLEELGIRKALGANSGQIIRQALTESLFLIFIAGLLSLFISIPFWQMLLNVNPSIVIRDIFNWEVFISSFIAFSLVGILIGWLSSFRLAKGNIVEYLNLAGS